MNNSKAVKINHITNKSRKLTDAVYKSISFLWQKKMQTLLLAYAIFAPISTVSAADAKWTAVINFILPWINRLGGVVILIGAVEFGLAFKTDDAEGKTKGMRTVIAGCIVLGVGLGSKTFLY